MKNPTCTEKSVKLLLVSIRNIAITAIAIRMHGNSHNTILCFCLIRSRSCYINLFVPDAPFTYHLKTSENLTVFWYFQGVEKGCIENKWVKHNYWRIHDLSFTKRRCNSSIIFSFYSIAFLKRYALRIYNWAVCSK